MVWTVEYESAQGRIEITLRGKTTGADLRELTTRGIEISKEENVSRCIVDATDAELAASLLDLFDLPSNQYAAEGLNYGMRVALILPRLEKERRDALFWETACVNRGRRVKTFPTRAEALEWLAGDGA